MDLKRMTVRVGVRDKRFAMDGSHGVCVPGWEEKKNQSSREYARVHFHGQT